MKYQKKDLEKFPLQVKYALTNYKKHGFSYRDFNNIILAGLGGSGIAGRIVKTYFQKISTLPVEVVSDYNLPFYTDDKTLVILNSYSGNTEETLSAYMEALEAHAKILVITTGGVLFELAHANKIKCYKPETGFQPRMALGYSLTFLFLILGELFDIDIKKELKETQKCLSNTDYYYDKAEVYFCGLQAMADKKWIIVTNPECYPIGVRFAQQINENAKSEAFVHELPEANHNVIETYYKHLDSVFVFIQTMHQVRLTHRFNFLEKLLLKYDHTVLRINMKGTTVANIYETIFILDWISLMMADKKKVNSNEIPNIIALKKFMNNK